MSKRGILSDALQRIKPETKRYNRLKAQFLVRIIDFMEKNKISKVELAKRLDVDKSMVSKWLSGGENLTFKTAAKIETALGIEVLHTAPVEPIQITFETNVIEVTLTADFNTDPFKVKRPESLYQNDFDMNEYLTAYTSFSKGEMATA